MRGLRYRATATRPGFPGGEERMGRVDDALRRAAVAEQTPPAPVDDRIDGLAAEPFPAERVNGDRAFARLDVSFEEPQSASASLFERLDARLAGKVVVDGNMEPACREQYRRLAAALHHGQAATGLKVVMIASAAASEGKT